MGFENIITEIKPGGVGLITLNRPKALNALSTPLMRELEQALKSFEQDSDVGCIVVTGSERAFAAGADIKEMAAKDFATVYNEDFVTNGWEAVSQCRKPVIAAVSGYALGGGCELALMCDFIIAADTAKFGQPEVTLGTLPGIGGTQRLARAVGKSLAMDLCLTGRQIGAAEALAAGLVARVVPAAELPTIALETAQKIASYSRPAVMLVKEAVNLAYETTLREGVRAERRLFHASFALADRAEGMSAFTEKRPPVWTGK
jgi:enoyl-CoA hydratase